MYPYILAAAPPTPLHTQGVVKNSNTRRTDRESNKSKNIQVENMSVSSNASSASRNGSVDDSITTTTTTGATTNTDSSELTHILNRRQEIMESQEAGIEVPRSFKVVNVYTEFHEFSRKQIKDYQKTFHT